MPHLRLRSTGLHLLVALALIGCSSGSAPGSSAPVGVPSSVPSASAAPSAPADVVDSPENAAARVFAEHPEFDGLIRKDPDLIGQCCWYEAREVEGGYEVVVEVGWGDCPAGCIDRHRWLFAVAPDGSVELIDETGDPVPSGALPGGPTD